MQPHHVPDSAWFYSTAEAVLNLSRFQGWLPNTVTFFLQYLNKKGIKAIFQDGLQHFKIFWQHSKIFWQYFKIFDNISRLFSNIS